MLNTVLVISVDVTDSHILDEQCVMWFEQTVSSSILGVEMFPLTMD